MKEYRFSGSLSVECLMSAFEARYDPDFNFTGEYHDFWEAVYIISSKAGISADDKIYSLSRSDIIFHKPMEFHRIWAIEGKPVHAFIFSFRLSGTLADRLKNKVIRLNESQTESMKALMDAFAENAVRDADTTDRAYDRLLHNWRDDEPMNMIIKCRTELLLLDIIKAEISPKEQYTSRSADIYRNIIKIMRDNVRENLSIGDIAKKCSFSEAYIKKIFSEFSDCGIHTYFMKLKIKEAVNMLEDGMSVGEISDALGFSNANYFTVCFKKETGSSPTKYIKSHR